MDSPLNRQLRFECSFACNDCQSIIALRTYRAIVEGLGQLVTCRHCKRPYRVYVASYTKSGEPVGGAEALPKDYQRLEGRGMPPPMSSLNIAQPPHRIQTLPFNPTVCYICSIPVKEHPPEPQLFIPGGKPEGM